MHDCSVHGRLVIVNQSFPRLASSPLALLAFIALPAAVVGLGLSAGGCSSSNSSSASDAGGTPGNDASMEASASDSGGPTQDGGTTTTEAEAGKTPPTPVPEPVWSGMTVEPGCTTNGCIHKFQMRTTWQQSILQGAADPTFTVNNGAIQYDITYVSDGAEITGSVFYPDSTPPPNGFDVVVMSQFTSGLAPSCAPSAGFLALGVASVPALNGYVTIVPDWTSYGKAPYGAYGVGPIAGKAALDAARAAFHTTQATGVKVERKAIIAGQSEGAYGTMAAATQFATYANQLEIVGFMAAETPTTSVAGFQQLATTDNSNMEYTAMELWSWQGLYSLSGGQLFAPPWDGSEADAGDGGNAGIAAWLQSECVFNGSGSSGTYDNHFPPDASTPSMVLSPTFFNYAKTGNWPADWMKVLDQEGTIPSYLPQPVLIFEGTADQVVLPAASDAYVAQLKAAGINVTYEVVDGGTHDTTALTSLTVAQLANDKAIAFLKATFAK